MAKDKLLRGTRLYFGGYDLSCDSRTFGTLENSTSEVDVTGWCETAGNYLSDKLRTVGLLGYQAIVNDASGRSHATLKNAPNSDVLSLAIGSGGAVPAIGDMAYLLPAIQMGAPVSFDGSIAIVAADFRFDADQMDSDYDNPWGVVLQHATSLTATTNAASVDNGASTANGGFGIVHITISDGGTWVLKIQHSIDDAAWADLITYTIIGDAIEAEGAGVSGTVNRYLRFQATRTSGTLTSFVTFARN